MSDISINLVGNVVTDVTLNYTKAGVPIASFRVAVDTGHFDKGTDRWVAGETHFLKVSCWRDLGQNVAESIVKGMPVIVSGRLTSREVQQPCGNAAHTICYRDVLATSVGIDLAKGISTFKRVKRDSVIRQEQRAIDEALGAAGTAA